MAKKPTNAHRSTLVTGDLIAADTALAQNTWTEVGRYTVSAGQGIALGYGMQRGQSNAEGRIYGDLNDTAAAALQGLFKLELRNPQDRAIADLFKSEIGALKTSATDRTQQMPLPLSEHIATEDWAIVALIKCSDASKTIDLSGSTLKVECTEYEMVEI